MVKITCSSCGKLEECEEVNLGQSPLIKIFLCEKCLEDLPDKLIGLPVIYKGKIVGKVIEAKLCQ